jgi:MFS family permease
MNDWKTLLSVPRFRAFWLALLSDNLGTWCVIATLPILVADRFGAGSALVVSLGLRILPKIVLAPLAGGLLRRFGASRVASLAMLGIGGLTALLPWCRDFTVLQALIAAIGTLDVFVNPGLMSLRSQVTPPGLEMAANTLCSVADRLGKIAGPTLGGLAVLAGFEPAFLGFAVAIALASRPVARLPPPVHDAEEPIPSAWHFLSMARDFGQMVRHVPGLAGLLVCAISYMVVMGGLRPFLFWANRDWFGASDTAWTGLLAAQGFGALIGALISGLFSRRVLRRMSAYSVTVVTGLLEGVLHLALLLATTSAQAITLLALAGIPEILSTATWFTAVQQRLSPQRQAVMYAFSAPLWDSAYAVGVLSAGLHASGTLSLSSYWAMVSLTSTLPLVPVLMLAGRQSQKVLAVAQPQR